MPSCVRAGIRKCARFRTLGAADVFLETEHTIILSLSLQENIRSPVTNGTAPNCLRKIEAKHHVRIGDFRGGRGGQHLGHALPRDSQRSGYRPAGQALVVRAEYRFSLDFPYHVGSSFHHTCLAW